MKNNNLDQYTLLNYWRRRFISDNKYLGNYFIPYNMKNTNFGTTIPYYSNGFSQGNINDLLYLKQKKI